MADHILTDYIRAAMQHAAYEILPDDEGFYGHIPGFQGLWANAPTLEVCREELQGALESWILVGLWHGHALPVVDQIDLTYRPDVVVDQVA